MGKKLTTEEFIGRATKVHNGRYTYDNAVYKNRSTKITITCKIHGDYQQRPGDHLNGFGCSECSGNSKMNTERFIKKAREKFGNKLDYSKVNYKNNRTNITIGCPIHGEFDTTPQLLLRGHGCPKCGGSSGELAISSILDKYGIEYKREFRVSINGKQYRYDFYIPIVNMLLEFHSGQHYTPVKIWGGEHGFKKRQASDIVKKRYAKENGYAFAVLNYLDIDNIEEVLKKKLTNICKYWFIKDGEMVATNSLVYIGKLYNVPGNTLVRDTISTLGIKLLF